MKQDTSNSFSRRHFIQGTSAAFLPSLSLPAAEVSATPSASGPTHPLEAGDSLSLTNRWKLDLTPARWIWFPARRTLPNSFFHFRRAIRIGKPVKRASGWVLGDSRYLLFCNGRRLQFGPAPSDPRFSEADPLDVTALLTPGENVLGATVLYYGFGDGTWPTGKPGFILKLDIEYTDGTTETVVSDESWQTQLVRRWQPGHYKRWYLRSLQEDFDARLYPAG